MAMLLAGISLLLWFTLISGLLSDVTVGLGTQVTALPRECGRFSRCARVLPREKTRSLAQHVLLRVLLRACHQSPRRKGDAIVICHLTSPDMYMLE